MTETLAPDAVDFALSDFFADRIRHAGRLGDRYVVLWQRLARSVEGGKRLRPRLVLDAHRAFGDARPKDAALAAAAFELLHTALLLHDDVIDKDLSRRGRPNLSGQFAADALTAGRSQQVATSWGDASGILGGDLLLSSAYALIARVPPDGHAELAAIIDECLFRAAAGEHADVAFGLGTAEATPDLVLRMMENKTSGYSFAAPLRAGAALARANEQALAELEQVGVALGVLYQVRDDTLGVFGDTRRTGKSTTGDLREGKRTLLIAFAEGHPAWTAVRHLWGRPELDDSGADVLRTALVASGAHDATKKLIEAQRLDLHTMVGRTSLPTDLQQQLMALADKLAERDS